MKIDGRTYVKTRENRWHYEPLQEHAIGSDYSTDEMMKILEKAKDVSSNIFDFKKKK